MSMKILVVDDTPAILYLLEETARQAGYDVTTACDGREALQSVQASRPDLIVLDIAMPHVDGLEVLHHLRTHEATTDIPIILLTASHGGVPYHVEEVGSGMTFCWSKPFDPAELARLMKRILE